MSPEGTIFCVKCGMQLPASAQFCNRCGTAVSPAMAAALVPPAAPVVSAAPAMSAAPMAPAAAPVAPAVVAPAVAAAPRYAGFWLRFGAIIIDAILLEFVIIPISMMLGFVIGLAGGAGGADQAAVQIVAAVLGGLFGLVAYWLYFALFESSAKQSTLGKRVVGVYVTDLAGRRISFARATGRHFAKLISSATLLIGYIMAGFTEKKQALHDMIAGTLVMRRS